MIIKGNILDVFNNSVYPAEITIENGLFEKIKPIDNENLEDIIIPGFIDSHIHIESSMLTPSQFAKVAVRHGSTSAICDPHEIANVGGIEAINFFVDDAKKVPFDFYFTAPSCVPATPFETSGAILNEKDIKELLIRDDFVALGEMMNFPGVINNDEKVLAKLNVSKELSKPIDGHAPLLSGEDLDKYIGAGISTDHECSSFQEAIEKKEKGMKIMVRSGSSAKNLDAIFDLDERRNYWKNHEIIDNLEENLKKPLFDFLVSDDKHADDLIKGYLNEDIRRVASFGIDIIEAIKMVTINPATHYNLNSGAIAEGRKANFVVIDNFDDFNIKRTYVDGKLVYDNRKVLFNAAENNFKNTFNLSKKSPKDFDVIYDGKSVEVNVMKCFNGELLTENDTAVLNVKNHIIQPDLEKDILKIAVVERYGGNSIANGFISGFNLSNGAIASSISHDSHNIIVIGTNSTEMAEAVNLLIENEGGLVVVNEGLKKSLPLPVAGLMSNKSAEEVSALYKELLDEAKKLNCKLDSPFMTMSFMALLVIPSLKISNKGLFDVDEFSFKDLIVN